MSSANGPQGPHDHAAQDISVAARQTVECQLFESLIHHLIEKGVLTRNDALSVVQTVAQVKRGEFEETGPRTAIVDKELAILKSLYSSFELVSDRPINAQSFDRANVMQLRPPVHGDRPQFPRDD